MTCHDFKGGTGTASRKLANEHGGYTVGVLVQANHGLRQDFQIAGIPVGKELADIPSCYENLHPGAREAGSIIAVLATDAPLLPHQLKRLARRVPLGISRLGSNGEHYSGDIFLAFSTANPQVFRRAGVAGAQMLANDQMTPLFAATVQAMEEAVLNALVAARTLTGIHGNTAYGLPHDRLRELFKR